MLFQHVDVAELFDFLGDGTIAFSGVRLLMQSDTFWYLNAEILSHDLAQSCKIVGG